MFVNFDLAAEQVIQNLSAFVQEDPRTLSACTMEVDQEEKPAPKPNSPVTTMAVGEEGGGAGKPSEDKPTPKPGNPVTTMAVGEEGG